MYASIHFRNYGFVLVEKDFYVEPGSLEEWTLKRAIVFTCPNLLNFLN